MIRIPAQVPPGQLAYPPATGAARAGHVREGAGVTTAWPGRTEREVDHDDIDGQLAAGG
jgi:hypothetical protein